jgi:cytochrome c biogenesis protein CcmG/thiol:disulfide interchange protein DsbE
MPCQDEFGVFQAVGTERGKEVAFLGIDAADNETSAKSLLSRRWLPFPSYSDPKRDIARAVASANGYPTTVFVDKNGKTVNIHEGAYTSTQQLNDDIDRAFNP